MPKFRDGEEVGVVDDFGTTVVKNGEIYEVQSSYSRSGERYIYIKHTDHGELIGMRESRFEAIEPKLDSGIEVKATAKVVTVACSTCGEVGHNASTCGKKKEIAVGDVVMYIGAATEWQGAIGTVKSNDGAYCRVGLEPGTSKGSDKYIETHDGFALLQKRELKIVSDPKVSLSKKEAPKLTIWEQAEMTIPESRLTLLYGPPGTGKTTIANLLGVQENEMVYNVTLTEETPSAELRGHFIPKGGEFIWNDGPALTAFRDGFRLVLNEIDKASGDALQFCHALLDDPGISRITLPTGETVYPNPGFKVIATMNGDPLDLPDALRDRFAVKFHIEKPHPDAIASLPKDLQSAASKGITTDTERSVSMRGWKTFAELREKLGEEVAAFAVFGSRAETILNSIKIGAMKK